MVYLWSLIGRLNQIVWLLFDIYMKWTTYSFVIRGRTRTRIFLALEMPKTPSQIAAELKLSTTHVSRALKELSDKGLVRCLTPKEKFGRIYNVTPTGRKLLGALKGVEK